MKSLYFWYDFAASECPVFGLESWPRIGGGVRFIGCSRVSAQFLTPLTILRVLTYCGLLQLSVSCGDFRKCYSGRNVLWNPMLSGENVWRSPCQVCSCAFLFIFFTLFNRYAHTQGMASQGMHSRTVIFKVT